MNVNSDNRTIAFLLILGFIAFAAFAVWETCKSRKRVFGKIRKTYGQWPEREYSMEEFDAISHYYVHRKKEGLPVIDDITWNDLDMDRIFMLLNHTWSCIGESYLYCLLRMPAMEDETLKERNRLIEYFRTHPEAREKMEYRFARIGKTGSQSMFDYIYNLAELKPEAVWPEFVWIIAVVVSFGSIFINAAFGVLLFLAVMFGSWYYYYRKKKRIEPFLRSCSCLIQILKESESFGKIDAPELKNYQEKIVQAGKLLRKLKRSTHFVVGGNAGENGELTKVFFDYINYTFHLDLIEFNTVIRELAAHMDDLEGLIDAVGALECATALTSFRTLAEGSYWGPEFKKGGRASLSCENVFHPLIPDPVKNSITAERGVLLTGSNASGKSTFLKTVAVNAILAQTIDTCMADSWKGNFFRICTSMALRDDLAGKESYFIVEIKSLKRILNAADGKIPILCFVDEVLRGTNTVERIAASSEILESMEREDILCFAATHDIELTHILEKGYDNYHFEEEVRDNDVLFNYRLFKGRAVSRNAIKLLGVMGYDPKLIEKAQNMADHFLETGEWRQEEA